MSNLKDLVFFKVSFSGRTFNVPIQREFHAKLLKDPVLVSSFTKSVQQHVQIKKTPAFLKMEIVTGNVCNVPSLTLDKSLNNTSVSPHTSSSTITCQQEVTIALQQPLTASMKNLQQNRIQPTQQKASIIGVPVKKRDLKANPLPAKLNKTGPSSATTGKTKSPSATFNSTGPSSSDTNTTSPPPIPSSSGCPKPASSSMDEQEKIVRWENKDVLTLLSSYEKFAYRFKRKMEKTDAIWKDVSEHMAKNGTVMAWEKCASKWKSLKERYQEIRDKNTKNSNGSTSRKSQWLFYDKMHTLLGESDAYTLHHRQDVGACGDRVVNVNKTDEPPSKKKKSRITNVESLSRLIELEASREERDEELLNTLKEQKNSNVKRNDAVIEAVASFKEVSAAIIASLRQTPAQASSVVVSVTRT